VGLAAYDHRVRLLVLPLAALAVACPAQHDDLPVTPGGGGGHGGTSGGGVLDAAPDSTTDGSTAGRVCLAADPRALDSCAGTGAGGLTVTLGSGSATTAADGTFALLAPTTSDLVWTVSGSAIMTSMMPFGPSATIPALSTNTYENLTTGNGVEPIAGEGDVFVQITQGGSALAGAKVSVSPPPAYAPYYDGNSSTTWNQNFTGSYGVAWVPGITSGVATVTVQPPATGSGSALMLTAMIGDQTLTFTVATITP
jgi:hypothetical protein